MPLIAMNNTVGNQKITSETLNQMRETGERPQVVDVRSVGEFAAGHLPGAINIPMETFESRLGDLDLSAPTILVCQSGNRAGIVCEQASHHFKNVTVLDGGTNAWVQNGNPVVQTTSATWSLERQVRFGAGLLVLTGVLLSIFVNPSWIWLSGFMGAGLTFAGFTNFCPMATVLAKLPWNRANANGSTPSCSQAQGA